MSSTESFKTVWVFKEKHVNTIQWINFSVLFLFSILKAVLVGCDTTSISQYEKKNKTHTHIPFPPQKNASQLSCLTSNNMFWGISNITTTTINKCWLILSTWNAKVVFIFGFANHVFYSWLISFDNNFSGSHNNEGSWSVGRKDLEIFTNSWERRVTPENATMNPIRRVRTDIASFPISCYTFNVSFLTLSNHDQI